ncbi:MAG TPA: universal stress protein [Acidimicrobiales bacterium]
MTSSGETNAASPVAATTAQYRAVLVPLDGSEEAERALAPAAWLAERFGAGLHQVAARIARDERWWYENYADEVRAKLPGSEVHLTDGRGVADAILGTAAGLDPCLVCMATHGRSRSAALLGSTFADVAAKGRAPLVAVGPRASAHTNQAAARLLVCLDGGPLAEQAVPLAASWARALDLRVSLVTVTDPILVSRAEAHADDLYPPDGDPQAYLDAVAARDDLAGLAVDREIMWGLAYPHIGIGEHLERHPAALVVATSHARTGVARAALGSEVAKIVHRSPAPVLVQPAARG